MVVTVRKGGVEGGAVVAAGEREVSIARETGVERVLVVVLIDFLRAVGLVVLLKLLAGRPVDRGSPGDACLLLDHRVLVLCVAGVGRHVVAPAVTRLCEVVAILDRTGEDTFEVLVLKVRRAIDVVDADCL